MVQFCHHMMREMQQMVIYYLYLIVFTSESVPIYSDIVISNFVMVVQFW